MIEIWKQFLDNKFLTYFIPIEPDVVYKLTNKKSKIFTKKKKS